ncbi:MULTISPECIES: hypothetical protein [Pelosinus]|uniref:hypothetical protein n=1 Tax=Pelosinus TaxID=365348 RepID=UPI0003690020|nr:MULTISPECIES: hypothetical protein [Pelosinus]
MGISIISSNFKGQRTKSVDLFSSQVSSREQLMIMENMGTGTLFKRNTSWTNGAELPKSSKPTAASKRLIYEVIERNLMTRTHLAKVLQIDPANITRIWQELLG